MHLETTLLECAVIYERDEILSRMCNKFRIYCQDTNYRSTSKLCSLGDVDVGVFSGAEHSGVAVNKTKKALDDEFFFIIINDGEAEVRNSQHRINLSGGQGAFLQKKDVFKYTISRSNHFLVKFPGRYIHGIPKSDVDGFVFDITHKWAETLRQSINLIVQMNSFDKTSSQFAKINILSGIMLLLEDAGFSSNENIRHSLKVDSFIRSMNDYWYNKKIDAKTFASLHNMSARTLHLCFASSNTTFGTELIKARVKNAAQVIQNPFFKHTPLIEIALQCGFSDDSHFRKRFKEVMGITPSEYRLRSVAVRRGD